MTVCRYHPFSVPKGASMAFSVFFLRLSRAGDPTALGHFWGPFEPVLFPSEASSQARWSRSYLTERLARDACPRSFPTWLHAGILPWRVCEWPCLGSAPGLCFIDHDWVPGMDIVLKLLT